MLAEDDARTPIDSLEYLITAVVPHAQLVLHGATSHIGRFYPQILERVCRP